MFARFRDSRAAAPVIPFEPKPAPAAAPAPADETRKPPATARFEDTGAYTDLKVKLHERLIEMLNLSALDKVDRDALAREVDEIVRELLEQEQTALNAGERARLTKDIIDELLGLGPLEPLLKDTTVNDILVNGPGQVFVERRGTLELTKVRFKDERHLRRIIDRIVAAMGRRIDESQPMVDARLPDGSRVNAVIPPIGVDGSVVSIRKFAKIPYDIDKLVANLTLTAEMADVLRALVRSRLNVLISGGTGSGKTTMLNALSSFIDPRERIVTIEDAAELQLQQVHVVRLETRPANIEGKGEVEQRDLVKNALRMRPDRVILGECRAGEAFDMLQAMNTGHDGSMTTIHANTPRDALSRLEQLIGMTGMDLPTRSMRAQIASAIHIVLQIRRFSDGRRRVVSLSEITGMEGEIITMQEIFRFDRKGLNPDGTVRGHHVATGVRPQFCDHLAANGFDLPGRLFGGDTILA